MSDVGDLLISIENAQSYIRDAMDELRGLQELEEYFDTLGTVADAMTVEKSTFEDYMSKEYQAEQDEIMRDYYRDR